jgi:hypothetical protein
MVLSIILAFFSFLHRNQSSESDSNAEPNTK